MNLNELTAALCAINADVLELNEALSANESVTNEHNEQMYNILVKLGEAHTIALKLYLLAEL